MAALTKADISDKLVLDIGLDKRLAKQLVEFFFEEVCLALEQNDNVKISGFGNFDLRNKVSRPGRNPKTGQAVEITPRRVVTFRSGQKLKEAIDEIAIKMNSGKDHAP